METNCQLLPVMKCNGPNSRTLSECASNAYVGKGTG